MFLRLTVAALATMALSACGSTKPSAAAAPQLTPGGWGAARLGMTKVDAAGTGLFDVDIKQSEPCPITIELQPKPPYTHVLDIGLQRGRIVDIAVWKDTVSTPEGIHIGSSWAEVKKAYPRATAPKEAGYGQSAVYLKEGDNYLGFLLNPKPADLEATDRVSYMEIQQGRAPDLMRDGC